MKRINWIYATTVGVVLSVGAAHAQAAAQPPSRTVGSKSVQASQTAGAAATRAIGESAEDLYDHGKVRDWTSAVKDTRDLRNALAEFRASGAKADLPALEVRVAKIELAVKTRKEHALMQEANALTRDAAELLRQFAPRIPVEVTLLDYYGRELEMKAHENDRAGLLATRTDIETTWHTVRPLVEKHGGAAAAAAFDRQMERLGRAKTPADFAAVATPILDDVDSLERVFAI